MVTVGRGSIRSQGCPGHGGHVDTLPRDSFWQGSLLGMPCAGGGAAVSGWRGGGEGWEGEERGAGGGLECRGCWSAWSVGVGGLPSVLLPEPGRGWAQALFTRLETQPCCTGSAQAQAFSPPRACRGGLPLLLHGASDAVTTRRAAVPATAAGEGEGFLQRAKGFWRERGLWVGSALRYQALRTRCRGALSRQPSPERPGEAKAGTVGWPSPWQGVPLQLTPPQPVGPS